ncbi:hypothetical protein BT96DRAFT_993918 [Gymnopus androsaceus JB14]|uniref:Uncharacterized protein n=1 Tax=Gymnopus androsaceus JB14 TaxID=1447944 RepID=A0A6A4HRV2_9AGAR|nr:hypothetical protein BT96DRAFT_993918 [Gymnopus androsaceus JB14]
MTIHDSVLKQSSSARHSRASESQSLAPPSNNVRRSLIVQRMINYRMHSLHGAVGVLRCAEVVVFGLGQSWGYFDWAELWWVECQSSCYFTADAVDGVGCLGQTTTPAGIIPPTPKLRIYLASQPRWRELSLTLKAVIHLMRRLLCLPPQDSVTPGRRRTLLHLSSVASENRSQEASYLDSEATVTPVIINEAYSLESRTTPWIEIGNDPPVRASPRILESRRMPPVFLVESSGIAPSTQVDRIGRRVLVSTCGKALPLGVLFDPSLCPSSHSDRSKFYEGGWEKLAMADVDAFLLVMLSFFWRSGGRGAESANARESSIAEAERRKAEKRCGGAGGGGVDRRSGRVSEAQVPHNWVEDQTSGYTCYSNKPCQSNSCISLCRLSPCWKWHGPSGKARPHPATPVMAAPRHTSDAVQAEREEKEEAKTSRIAAQDKAIARTAELENQMQVEDFNTEESPKLTCATAATKKALEPPPVANETQNSQSAVNESQGSASVKRNKAKRKQDEVKAIEVAQEVPTTVVSDPDDGDEDYEVDIEAGLNDSGEKEPPAKKPRARKPQKGELRALFLGKRDSDEHPESGRVEITSNQETSEDFARTPFGMELWRYNTFKTPTHPTSQQLDADGNTSVEFDFGGFGDNDEGNEHLRMLNNPAKPLKVKSIAAVVQTPSILKVEPTTSVAGLVTPTNKQQKDICLKDLPKDVQQPFTEIFMPVIIEFSGCIDAWTSPTATEIADLWDSTMPSGIHNRFSELNAGKAIEVLVQDKLTTWRNSIGKAALKTLKKIFSDKNLTTADQRKAYIAQQMNGTYKSYVYYYSHVVGEGQNVQYAGPFQLYIISRTLAEHLKAIDSIPADERIADRPTGALVLAILAAHRALTFYSTGFVWGDKLAMVEGIKKQYKTTSNLHSLFGQNPVKKIHCVSAAQWERILATACAHIEKLGAEPKPKATPSPAQSEPQSDEDWELLYIDPDTLIAAHTAPTTKKAPESEPEAATSVTAVTAGSTSDVDQSEAKAGDADLADGMVESNTGGDSDEEEEEEEEEEPEEGGLRVKPEK